MLTCRDQWSSLDSQDFRYDAGYGRTGAEIYTISEVTFSWALVSFASIVTFDFSLEDLIQGVGDTSWVIVEGWEGGTSGRVKSQLPSLRLGHVWGTTYIPSSLWKQALASLSMTCMISDPDWFHPFSCPASPETSLVSLQEFLFIYFFNFGCTRSLLLLRTSLFAVNSGYSVIAVHWLFYPVLLLM